MSNQQASPRPRRRAPNGCFGKPVWMNLTPVERANLEATAEAEGQTLSAQARVFYLRGIEVEESYPAPSTH